MARKPAREHMVSIRLTEVEERFLRTRARKAGRTLSDVVRNLIAQSAAPPPPAGESVGSPHRFVQVPGGGLAQVGVFWPDGGIGGTYTTQMLTEESA